MCVIFYELLPTERIINLDVYCDQLDKVNAAMLQKRLSLANRKGIVLHHDNVRTHISICKCARSYWDLGSFAAPSIFARLCHLFQSLQNLLNGQTFNFEKDAKVHLEEFFSIKHRKYLDREIMDLFTRWQKILKRDDKYTKSFVFKACVLFSVKKPKGLFDQANISVTSNVFGGKIQLLLLFLICIIPESAALLYM